MITWCITNHSLGEKAWDPYPFILLNLVLSMIVSMKGRRRRRGRGDCVGGIGGGRERGSDGGSSSSWWWWWW